MTALEWRDVDLDIGKIRIGRSVPANTLTVGHRKSSAGRRVVDLPCPLQHVLMDLPQSGHLIFPGTRGGYLNHKGWMRTVWRPTILRLGLHLRFHDLRHFCASLLFAFGENVLTVAYQLGHSSPSVTLNVYGHLMREGRKLDREATLAQLMKAFRAPAASRAAQVRPEDATGRRRRGPKPAPELVETSGFEPPTPSLRTRCSPS